MQAHRLRAADAPYHARVVKALVDQTTHSAAFLLADSSCLLVSLTATASPASSYIPSPCTDACFLRLLARMPAVTSLPIPSPALHPILNRGGAKISPGSPGEPIVLKGGSAGPPRVGFREMILDAQIVDAAAANDGSAGAVDHRNEAEAGRMTPRTQGADAPIGTSSTGAKKSQVFLLAARPGKGGSRTDLMGWRCKPHCFCRVATSISSSKPELGIGSRDVRTRCVSRRVASLDVPHGMMVKLSATVNVVALYSVAAGKIWIMSAKAMESGYNVSRRVSQNLSPHLNGVDGSHVTRNHLDGAVFASDAKGKVASQVSDRGCNDGLYLMKCAVVDCNTPVFSLHLSPQHLLLGEKGGIRVFHLRSLVKPRKRLGKREESLCVNDQAYLCEHVRSNFSGVILDHISNGISNCRRSPRSTDKDQRCSVHTTHCTKNLEGLLDPVGRENDEIPTQTQVVLATGPMNGIHGVVSSSGSVMGGEFMSGHAPKNPGVQYSKAYVLDGFLFEEKVELEHQLENEYGERVVEMTSNTGTEASSTSSNKAMPNHLLCVQTCRHPTGYSSIVSPGKINFWKRNGTIPRSGEEAIAAHVCCQPQDPYLPKMTHTMPLPVKMLDHKGSHLEPLQGSGQGPTIFVGLAGGGGKDGVPTVVAGAIRVQVVDIQCLGAKDFVVLDSSGRLHLMTLQNSWFLCNNVDDHELRTKMLKTSLKVLSLTVLPVPSGIGSPAVRTVWLADGGRSIHIVSLPRDKSSEEDGERIGAVWDSFPELPVVRAVYTKDPVTALLASSPSSVMVLGPASLPSTCYCPIQLNPVKETEQNKHLFSSLCCYSFIIALRVHDGHGGDECLLQRMHIAVTNILPYVQDKQFGRWKGELIAPEGWR